MRRSSTARRTLAIATLLLATAQGCTPAEEPADSEEPPPDPPVGAQLGTPTPKPWALEDDPIHAKLGIRKPRTFPLWQTPVSDPVPDVMFGAMSPAIERGEVFERVTARLAKIVDRDLGFVPSDVILVRDHIDAPGLHLWAVTQHKSSCMMGWRHTHCLASDHGVYCPDGTPGDLERLVRDHELAPRTLSRPAWFELAVVMAGIERFVVEPRLADGLSSLTSKGSLAPSVEIDDARVVVQLTSMGDNAGHDHTITITREGTVTFDTEERWRDEPRPGIDDEEVWGELAQTAIEPLEPR